MIGKWLTLGGVPLYDLEKFCNLLNELANTTECNQSKIIQAVQLAAKPFLKKNASDQEYVKCVPGLKDSVLWYSDLGTLFQISLDSGLGLLDSPEKIKRLGTF